MITKTVLIRTRIVISYAMKQGNLLGIERNSIETETTT